MFHRRSKFDGGSGFSLTNKHKTKPFVSSPILHRGSHSTHGQDLKTEDFQTKFGNWKIMVPTKLNK